MRRSRCILLLACVAATVMLPSPASFATGVAESNVRIRREDDSVFDALLYTPADQAAPAWPVIVFAHGFLSPPDLYRATCRELALSGYAVIATRSGLELFPDHAAYAADLSDCLDWAEQANGDPSSPLYGRIDLGNYGVTGHSMGGGASLLAAAMDPRFRAVAPMAAAETRPSAIDACAGITAPLLFITGSEDSFVPNPFHTRPMFERTAAPSVWMDIQGAYHCGFIRIKLPEAVCDEGSLSRFEQLAIVHPLLVSFFDLTLKGEDQAWDAIWGAAPDLDRRLVVRRKHTATISPERVRLSVPAGGSSSFTINVTNTGDRSRRFDLRARVGAGHVSLDPAQTGIVPPGQGVPVSVTISQPAGLRLKNNVVEVKAIPADDPGQGGDYAWGLIRVAR